MKSKPSAFIFASHSSFGGKFGRQFAATVKPLCDSALQIAVPRPPIAPVTNAIFFAISETSYNDYKNLCRPKTRCKPLPSARDDQYMC